MTAGVPGIALAGIFYLLCALTMPVVEVVRTLRGTSSLARWSVVWRQASLALVMIAGIQVMFRTLNALISGSPTQPAGLAEPALARVAPFAGSRPFLATAAIFLVTLTLVELARFVVPSRAPHHR